jgi:hypothetical protein
MAVAGAGATGETMGKGRRFTRPQRVRPRKKPGDKRRRAKTQQRRLVALGVPEEKVARMTTKAVRQLLARPGKLAGAR